MNDFNFEMFWAAIQEMTNLAQEIFNNPAYRDYIRIIILGTESSGKSTLFHLLIGDKIVAMYTSRGFILDCFKSKAKQISINKCMKSMFLIPNVYVDHQNKFIFIDCPSFYNSQFSYQDLLNIFSIHTILKAGGKFKFLLVIHNGAFHFMGGYEAIRNFEFIDYLIPDKNLLKQSLALFITKTDDFYDNYNILNYMKYFRNVDNVWLIDYFLNEGKNKVFRVPRPIKEGDYNNFINNESVFEALRNYPIELQRIKNVLHCKKDYIVTTITIYLHDELRNSLKEFMKTIFSYYEKETDLSKLLALEKKLYSLIDAAKIGLYQFIQQISIDFEIESFEINKNTEKINIWMSFVHDTSDESLMMKDNDFDLSPLILSVLYHLVNIKNIEKQLQQKDEKELPIEDNQIDELNSMIKKIKENNEKNKIILDEKTNKLKEELIKLEKENEILQRKIYPTNDDNNIKICLII